MSQKEKLKTFQSAIVDSETKEAVLVNRIFNNTL